jgi:hypothetical protein
MENTYYPLGNAEDNRFVKLIRVVFGAVCISMAAYWVYFNLKALKTDWTMWITIFFLLSFGLYQIWAGTGKATRFISIGSDHFRLKMNSIFSPIRVDSATIEKIEFYPLSIVFLLKSGKNILLRFGTVHYETNEKIVDALISFAEKNNISFEVKEESI